MAQPTTLPSPDAQKQAAVAVFAQYEPPLYEAYLDMMLEWLAAVKVAMFTGGVARLGLVPDPMAVFSQGPKWAGLMTQYTDDVARDVLAAPYKDLFADGTLFESRPFVRNWIAGRENRLNKVPTEVFGLVSHIIDSATVNGASIPDVTAQVEQLFDATDIPKWKNRARTVARTEVVGAYNGGLHDAFSMIADNDPETEYVHRWLATDDARTRPDHVEADGQVQPWGQPYTVGGFQMMHPHDPTAPAKEVVNCRCVELMEIKNEPTKMSNRQYKGPPTLAAAARPGFVIIRPKILRASGMTAVALPSLTLLQAACTDGQFCQQTHKPGLCKGQKRGQSEPGVQDETKRTPAQVAQTAVNGLSEAIQQAQAVAAQNATNPKLAALARRAIAGYKKALVPHRQTLKDAAHTDAKSKRAGDQDTAQQDVLDRRDQRHRDSLKRRAEAILNRRKIAAEDKAKLAKMTPKQRTAYRKAKADKVRARHEAQENKTIKEAGKS